jgi:hypothetical protein
LKVPVAVGVPLIVIVFDAHAAVTPAGNPVAGSIPVALVVVCVMFVITVFTVTVGVDEAAPAAQAGAGVTELDAAEAAEFPAEFVATTVNV